MNLKKANRKRQSLRCLTQISVIALVLIFGVGQLFPLIAQAQRSRQQKPKSSFRDDQRIAHVLSKRAIRWQRSRGRNQKDSAALPHLSIA